MLHEDLFFDLQGRVSQAMNFALTQPFTKEEIKKSLFDMHPAKAPGVDGMPAGFFQNFWSIIGESVTKACLKFLNEGCELGSLNHTLIALIPKVKDPKLVTEFRPISLCTVVYKILSKTIANRLKPHLPAIILPEQSAFVPGRQILDNVLVAFETMHKLKAHRKGKVSLMAIKLDMSKAYDRVEWPFLRAMMEKLGFCSKWIDLVMKCVSAVSYSVLVNGRTCGDFKPTRGLRQGDPLSPYLFLLCMEGLVSILRKCSVENNFMALKLLL